MYKSKFSSDLVKKKDNKYVFKAKFKLKREI